MPILVYVVCRNAMLGAGAAAVLHCGYATWRQRRGRLPLRKDGAEEAVAAWAVGAAVGQFCVAIPLLFHPPYAASAPHVAWATVAATLLLSPLYAAAAHPTARRAIAQHVPYLIAGGAASTAMLVY
eukprot:EG_transcript_45133